MAKRKRDGIPRLYTYIIPIDDGAAPNPFQGICSLAICKPAIRRTAKKDDWVAGVGSKNVPSGDLTGRLVYAMRTEEVISLKEYDDFATTRWPHRVPNVYSADLSKRLGDCIYDYSRSNVVQRPGVHGPGNMQKDLSGVNVLISSDFYYFGRSAIEIPLHLRCICPQTQGHRSTANTQYFDDFVKWIRALGVSSGQHGWPDFMFDWNRVSSCGGCLARELDDECEVC